MTNQFKPMNNVVAILVTIAFAIVFFILFMLIPEPENKKASSPAGQTSGNARAFPSGLTGEVLFDRACSQCHTPPPLTHRSPEDWRILVLKMNRNMQQTGKNYLTPEEIQPVVDYILSHQKPA
ncbi:c-type cytochrome [Leptospirillum ferriphilum]|uniref:Cytochrome c domain-containing protein n=3 Tax=Leptospirillum TaxID=179 RepID=A0A094YJH1_9BACT|nr:cytochrome c [Leptospirillum ferriphilum]AFS54121.1 hypothetical protein LFML04_1921 [Leptospirillum ferriphilum ML-04]KGA93361.1 hypothetical protein LptCag_0397 [Leptospirillum ferriphilum]